MRNGLYWMIIPPPGYPGKWYRGRYAYEHRVVFWQTYGRLPKPGYVVHHKNGRKHDNSPSNLEEKLKAEHSRDHTSARGRTKKHGVTMYSHYKCRCQICRKAWRILMKKYRQERR